MRKCIRCGADMQENCAIKVEGAGYDIMTLFKAGSGRMAIHAMIVL